MATGQIPPLSARVGEPQPPLQVDGQSGKRTVRARVQPRPGAAPEEIDMRVRESPVAPPSVAAWAEDSAGELLMSVLAYEQGWRNFYPHTNVWR